MLLRENKPGEQLDELVLSGLGNLGKHRRTRHTAPHVLLERCPWEALGGEKLLWRDRQHVRRPYHEHRPARAPSLS